MMMMMQMPPENANESGNVRSYGELPLQKPAHWPEQRKMNTAAYDANRDLIPADFVYRDSFMGAQNRNQLA